MRGYLLDTDICIHFLRREPSVQKFVKRNSRKIFLCTPVMAELYRGIVTLDLNKTQRFHELNVFFNAFPRYVFSEAAALEFGNIFYDVKRYRRQMPAGAIDVLIAAIARQAKLTVVTRNARHFSSIPNLDVLVV